MRPALPSRSSPARLGLRQQVFPIKGRLVLSAWRAVQSLLQIGSAWVVPEGPKMAHLWAGTAVLQEALLCNELAAARMACFRQDT